MHNRSFLPYFVLLAFALAACANEGGEPSAASTAEVSAACNASAFLTGQGLVDDLRAAVDARFVEPGRGVAVPGALHASNHGFTLFGLERVEAVGDAAVVATGEATATVVLGAKGQASGPLGDVVEAAARKLFDAMSQANETLVGSARRRTTARGFVSCTEHATSPASHECTIKNVQSISPSVGPVFDRPICGLVACQTTLVRLRMGVIEDLVQSLSPELQKGELAIPEVLTGFVGMGTETLTTVGGVRIDDETLLTEPASPLYGTFGGRRVGDGPTAPGFRAAKALYEAMSRVPETIHPLTGAHSRKSPGGRVLCTEQSNSMDGGVFFSCQITAIHRYAPAAPGAGSAVCASPSP